MKGSSSAWGEREGGRGRREGGREGGREEGGREGWKTSKGPCWYFSLTQK